MTNGYGRAKRSAANHLRGQMAGEVLIAAKSNDFDMDDVLTLCRTYYDKSFAEMATDELRQLRDKLIDLTKWDTPTPSDEQKSKEQREAAALAQIGSDIHVRDGSRSPVRCDCVDCR